MKKYMQLIVWKKRILNGVLREWAYKKGVPWIREKIFLAKTWSHSVIKWMSIDTYEVWNKYYFPSKYGPSLLDYSHQLSKSFGGEPTLRLWMVGLYGHQSGAYWPTAWAPKRFHRASGFLFFNHTVSLCISLSEIFSHKEGECRNIYSEVLNSLLFQNAVLALGNSATT